MADQKVTALNAETAPVATDLLYLVDDPGGAPASRKIAVGDMPGYTEEAAYAARPAAAVDGKLFLPNDGYHLERDTGAAWAPWGPLFPMTVPPAAGWSWDNQDGTVLSAANGPIILSKAADAGDEISVYYRNVTAPYVITGAMMPPASWVDNNRCGFVFRQSSDGKLIFWGMQMVNGYWQAILYKFTNSTTYSAFYNLYMTQANQYLLGGAPLFWRMEVDGANRIVSMSHDGVNFFVQYSVGRTDFLTADQVGIAIASFNGAYGTHASFISWKET